MSTPVCIANAVADALGAKDIELPLVPAKLASDRARCRDRAARRRRSRADGRSATAGSCAARGGDGRRATPSGSGRCCSIPQRCGRCIPGCQRVQKISDTHFRADVTLGIGPVKGRYRAEVKLSDLDPPRAVTLARIRRRRARIRQRRGTHHACRRRQSGGTAIRYNYDAAIGGKVASIGGRLLDGAARVIIWPVLRGAGARGGGGNARRDLCSSLLAKLRRLFGGQP